MYSRERLRDLLDHVSARVHKILQKERLLNKFLMDYNISPCPVGGEFHIEEDGSVSCTIHKKPANGNQIKKPTGQ